MKRWLRNHDLAAAKTCGQAGEAKVQVACAVFWRQHGHGAPLEVSGCMGVTEPSGAHQTLGTIFYDVTDYLSHPKTDLWFLFSGRHDKSGVVFLPAFI
jgi:hypothetical protein